MTFRALVERSLLSLTTAALTLFLTTSTLSCASLRGTLPPTFVERTYRVSPDRPGVEYQWEECVKRFLGICTKYEWKSEFHDFTNRDERAKFIAAGFRVVVPGP